MESTVATTGVSTADADCNVALTSGLRVCEAPLSPAAATGATVCTTGPAASFTAGVTTGGMSARVVVWADVGIAATVETADCGTPWEG
jgi:hypothetical protein